MKQLYTFGLCVAALCTLALIACQGSNAGTETKPNVIIASPPHGSTFTVGQVVAVQSSAADVTGISRVELLVDGAQVQQDAPPSLPAPTQFTLIQNWTATIPGTHTVTVREQSRAIPAKPPSRSQSTLRACRQLLLWRHRRLRRERPRTLPFRALHLRPMQPGAFPIRNSLPTSPFRPHRRCAG